jgi:hypothetical protein
MSHGGGEVPKKCHVLFEWQVRFGNRPRGDCRQRPRISNQVKGPFRKRTKYIKVNFGRAKN